MLIFILLQLIQFQNAFYDAEYSSDQQKQYVESQIVQFQKLPPYFAQNIYEMNHQQQDFKIALTQQILNQGKNDGGVKLLQKPDDLERYSFLQINNNNLEQLEALKCWASSRFEFAFVLVDKIEKNDQFKIEQDNNQMIQMTSYPCKSHYSGKQFQWSWLSEAVQVENTGFIQVYQELVFKMQFESVKRVSFYQILFMIIPQQIKIEISTDMINWKVAKDYYGPPEDLKQQFWDEKGRFDPPIFAKGIKIIMKGFRNQEGRHGISKIQFYSQQQAVMIIEKNNLNRVIIRDQNEYLLIDAIQAISFNDGREIFLLDKGFIKSIDGNCLSRKGKLALVFFFQFKQKQCQNENMIVDDIGKIIDKKSFCLTATQEDSIDDLGQVQQKENQYQLLFDQSYLIEKIEVNWKIQPKQVKSQIRNQFNQWISIDIKNYLNKQISGIRIISDQVIQIKVYRPGFLSQLQIKDWIWRLFKLEDVAFYNNNNTLHNEAQQKNVQIYLETLKIIQKFVSHLKDMQNKVQIQNDIYAQLQLSNQQLQNMTKGLVIFKEQKKQKNCLGCFTNPAISCQAIKKTGYFWIQSQCMTNPQKVYCDSQYFLVFHQQKIKQIKQINKICNNIGLHSPPIQFIIKNLNKIPFTNYPIAFLNQNKKWQSFHNSSNIDDLLKNYTDILPDSDILVVNQQFEIEQTKFKDFQIERIICTDYYKEELEGIKLSCDSLLGQLNLKTNIKVKVKCPFDCLKESESKVYGNQPYSEFSSICRAAIHRGVIQDQIGGSFLLIAKQGLEQYESSTQNKITSQTAAKDQKSFILIKNPNNCPNTTFSFKQLPQPDNDEISLQFDNQAALKKINEILNMKDKLDQILFIKDTNNLLKQHEKIIDSIYQSNLDPKKMENNLNIIQNKLKIATILLKQFQLMTQHKTLDLQNQIQQTKSQIIYNNRFQPLPDYTQSFDSMFLQTDSIDCKNSPSKWKVTQDNVFPHKNGIYQESEISCNEDLLSPKTGCFSTMLQLKYRKYFDFNLTLDFKVTKQGSFGVIFRQKDEFNYYAFILSKNILLFKRVVDGLVSYIEHKEIKGIISDTWYNLRLETSQTELKLFMDVEKDFKSQMKYKILPQIMKLEDQYFKNGYISLTTDNTLGMYFDNLDIVANQCKFETSPQQKLNLKCQRYKENYKVGIDLVWQQDIRKPIQWIYKDNKFQRKKVIFKKVGKNLKSDNALNLKNKIFKDQGYVLFDFVFDSQDDKYSCLILMKDLENNIEIRFQQSLIQIIDNDKQVEVLQEKQFDFKIGIWNSIYIAIDGDIEIKMKQDEEFKQIFMIDKLEKSGNKIGFHLIKGQINIDQFQLQPGKIIELQKDELRFKAQNDDYQQCINLKTQIQRNQWCQNQHFNDQCDFCQKCCQTKIRKQNIISICENQCKQSLQPSSNDNWKQCSNPTRPTQSVYKYCLIIYQEFPEDKLRCQLDFCYLCCINIPIINQDGLAQNDIDKCYESCYDRFKI